MVGRVEGLADALEEAGVDEADYADYRAENPPDDVSRAGRNAIEAAARRLGDAESQRALAGVEQQALDVCKTPLSVT